MPVVPNCDKAAISAALRGGLRLDGRGLHDFRELDFEFSPDSRSCCVRFGGTRVLSVINAEVGPTKGGRDRQGTVTFKVGFEAALLPETSLLGNVKYQTAMLLRWLERLFFMGNALDREALCIVAGKKVWHLEVDVRVLDYDGNAIDACTMSVLGVLSAYRSPQVTAEHVGEDVKLMIHPSTEREPIPLTLHHWPISVSFATFEGGEGFVVDPTLMETAAMRGSLTCVGDPQGKILNVRKVHGMPLAMDSIQRCCTVALEKTTLLSKVTPPSHASLNSSSRSCARR